jgi:hypothetical protein
MDNILIKRVVGKDNKEFVKKFIIRKMKGIGWSVE